MNNLCRLIHVKRDIAGVSGLTDTSTTVLGILQAIDDVSREFEGETQRQFHATLGTRYLHRHPRACPTELMLEEDLASISGITVDDDGDETFELTLVENTDYFVEREQDLDSNTPIVVLRLNPNGTQLSSWPTARRAIKIIGLWGYSYEREDSTLTLLDPGPGLDVSETGVTLSATAASIIYPGDTIVIDSEQMQVTAVSTSTLTVARAINGTVAAVHSDGAAVYIRRYPRRVESAIKERVVGIRWDTQTGAAAQITLAGEGDASGVSAIRASYARWRRTVNSYKNWRVL